MLTLCKVLVCVQSTKGPLDTHTNQSSVIVDRRISRTLQAENRGIFKNSQLQINFTGSYKKRV